MTDEQLFLGPDSRPRETVYKPKPNSQAGDNIVRLVATELPDSAFAKGIVGAPIRFKDAAAFMREYEPISYTIGGVLPSDSLYFLTGPKSHGKTVFLLACMFAVTLNRPELLGVDEVEPGHVAYVALENAVDIRMKMAACVYCFNVMPEELVGRATIIDQRMPPKEIFKQLKLAAEQKGPLQAIFYDTFQAGFSGATGINDNLDMLLFCCAP